MNFHEIIVSPDGERFAVTIAPPLPLERVDESFPTRDLAMTFARLLRLQHGFSIVPPEAAGVR